MTRRLLVAVFAVLLAAGCNVGPPYARHGAGHGTSHTATVTTGASKPTQFLTVRQLAAAVGCEAKLQGKGADFRQATCTMTGAQFVFVDFDTAEGQREWLDYAVSYGGTYLVGERWAVTGESRDSLETLRDTVGGAIEGTA